MREPSAKAKAKARRVRANAREGLSQAARARADKALWDAAGKGEAEVCRLVLDAGADPASRDDQGRTALIIAVEAGHALAAELVAGAMSKAELGMRMRDGRCGCALYAAVAGRAVDMGIARMLAKLGADVEEVSSSGGSTMLMRVAGEGSVQARVDRTRALLDLGANPRACDERGRSAMARALRDGCDEVALALAPVSDLDARDGEGFTMLMAACKGGCVGSVRLLANRERANEQDSEGLRPIDWAIRANGRGRVEMCSALMPLMDPWSIGDCGRAPMEWILSEVGDAPELAAFLVDAMAGRKALKKWQCEVFDRMVVAGRLQGWKRVPAVIEAGALAWSEKHALGAAVAKSPVKKARGTRI